MNNLDLADFQYLSYAEWISGDYSDFVKKSVLPTFSKRYNLKLRETRVLNSVAASVHNCTASVVSDDLRQDPATVTRSLVILIGKGYIESQEDFNDGRSRILMPTEQGQAAADYFLEIFKSQVDNIASTSRTSRVEYDHGTLTRSLELVAKRAKAFKEAQRKLAKILKNNVTPSLT